MLEKVTTESFKLAESFLNKTVEVSIDRPLGSLHPKHGFIYEANYGYIKDIKAPDGEDLDAYFLGVSSAIESGNGKVIAIVHRLKDDDDKLVVVPEGVTLTDVEIDKAIYFQEKWFEHIIVRQ